MVLKPIKMVLYISSCTILLTLSGCSWGAKKAITPQTNTSKATSTSTTSSVLMPPAVAEERLHGVAAAVEVAAQKDQDLDGLTDDEEKKYGTSPTLSDTDSDGLLDKDEVVVYRTNPLVVDSDGDGYADGFEVQHGYNPKGEGKLY